MLTREQALARIRKLLALADIERGATQDEAELAAVRASELMAAYNLEAAEVAEEAKEAPSPIVYQDAVEIITAQCDNWRGILGEGIDVATGCLSHWKRNVTRPADPTTGAPGDRGLTLRFYGTVSSTAAACYLYASLCRQVDRLAGMYRGMGRSWLNAYRIGLASALASRLSDGAKAARAAQVQTVTSAALVRIDREAVAVRETFAKVKLSARRALTRCNDSGGYQQGRADAVGVAIGGGRALGAGRVRSLGRGQEGGE